MKVSCNGCRVLRKGCNESCTIRPCLEWIPNPDSQSNATLFLAKFYGRSGLLNLIEAGPSNLRPATFRSLLYEACGRMVSPMYGSLGLLWSGNWGLCQAAVEAVLKGEEIIQIPTTPAVCSDASASVLASPLQTCDIRHASKDPNTAHLSRMKSRTQFKRTTAPPAAAAAVAVAASNTKPNFLQGGSSSRMNKPGGEGWRFEPWRIISRPQPLRRTADSSRNGGSSVFSFETLESFLMNRGSDDDRRICLDLTLGLPMRN